MRTFIYKTAQIALILLIILTIAHAFYQSSLPMKESAENSSKVEEIIEEVIPPETKPGAFIKENIRKLAHFTEFFLLGLWCVLFTLSLKKKTAAALSLIPFGMTNVQRDPSLVGKQHKIIKETCIIKSLFLLIFMQRMIITL